MRIKSVTFEDYPPFKDLRLEFPGQLTVIAGSNGVGKSRLLQILSQGSHPGASIEFDRVTTDMFSTVAFAPYRHFPHYQPSVGLLRYSQRYSQLNIFNGLQGFEEWFAAVNYHQTQGDLHSPQTEHNFNLCKETFAIVDSEYSFRRVDQEFRVVLNGPAGDVLFSQTSSGFQSAYILLTTLILNVDQHLNGNDRVDRFDGCILIDEIDLHLHPTWQVDILRKIQRLVPRAQIIATTHSAHVIQGLRAQELIALELKQGRPRLRQVKPAPGPYGFQGWTIEEILRDVMGLKDERSPELINTVKGFKNAVRSRNLEEAQRHFLKLMQMLHPRNDLRLMYQMEFEAIGGQA